MSREAHAPFCEGLAGKFRRSTLPQENIINLLKKFCAEHYNKALITLEKENEGKRQEHVQTLKSRRQKKIKDFERMFFNVLENAFIRNLNVSLTLPDEECYSYDQDIAFYGSDTFWSTFDVTVRTQESMINLLKKFCAEHYNKARITFEKKNEGKRQEHVQTLKSRRQKKIEDIERMFYNVLENAFVRNLNVSLIMTLPASDTTLSDYKKAIASYRSDTFWSTFDVTVRTQENMINLLKKFCAEHYNKARITFEKENEGKRQEHVQTLKSRRQKKIEDIERRTDERVREVIASLTPKKEKDDSVAFDFAWHREYYDQVCAPASLKKLATDPREQEVVYRYYAEFMSRHSHEQMMRWYQKFSKEEEFNRRMVTMETRLVTMESRYASFLGSLIFVVFLTSFIFR